MWVGYGVGWREKSTGNHGFYPPKSGMSSLGDGELGMDLLLYFRPASRSALRVVWHVAHVAIINPKQKHSSNLPQALRAKCLWSCWNLGVFFHQTRTAAQALPWMKISGTQCSHRNNVVNFNRKPSILESLYHPFLLKCAIDSIPQLVSWFWWTFIAVFIWYSQSRPCIS